jgi:hypothetical protein
MTTIGRVPLALLAARAARVPPPVTMTSTLSDTVGPRERAAARAFPRPSGTRWRCCTLGVAEVTQSLEEGLPVATGLTAHVGHQVAHSPHAGRLLRPHSEGRAEQAEGADGPSHPFGGRRCRPRSWPRRGLCTGACRRESIPGLGDAHVRGRTSRERRFPCALRRDCDELRCERSWDSRNRCELDHPRPNGRTITRVIGLARDRSAVRRRTAVRIGVPERRTENGNPGRRCDMSWGDLLVLAWAVCRGRAARPPAAERSVGRRRAHDRAHVEHTVEPLPGGEFSAGRVTPANRQ